MGALQRLDLTLFVHAQHQRLVGRVEIQPHHIANLFHEERIGGKLKAFAAMRLDVLKKTAAGPQLRLPKHKCAPAES